MGAKWIRSQQWDDAFFPAWAWPAKFLLRAFSSIWLAVLLLSIVSLFGVLASVPVGMLAAIPTWLVYIASFLLVLVIFCAGALFLAARAARALRAGAPLAFLTRFIAISIASAAAWLVWHGLAWPHLRYDPVHATGFRFFGEICDTYRGTVLRRLPGLEMSELEFYSWWPLRLVLLAFVANMVIATLRRIDFEFKKIGVLTVHTGIVTIALGSIYYNALKQEGDVLILAGEPDDKGNPTPGRPALGFFDNTDVSLWLAQLGGDADRGKGEWEQRSLAGLPRYNDYGLDAAGPAIRAAGRAELDAGRTLALDVDGARSRPLVDDDIRFRVVGYCSYGELRPTWVVPDSARPAPPGSGTPARHIELLTTLPLKGEGDDASIPPPSAASAPGAERTIGDFILSPVLPGARVGALRGVVAVEYLESAKPEYWSLLQTRLPDGALHGLVITIPGAGVRQVVAAEPDKTIDTPGGWTITVKSLHPEPPLSVITPGFEGATSPVAVLRVQKPRDPAAPESAPRIAFERYVYARFPELNQDLLEESTGGMPKRRAADEAIRIEYIDASTLSAVIDGGDGTGPARAIVRVPGREPVVVDALKQGEALPLVPMVSVRLGERHANATRIEAPWPTPERDRDRNMIGNHRAALIAVEVSLAPKDGRPAFRAVEWVQHNPYHPTQPQTETVRSVNLPDGRRVGMSFGRRYHQFPGFAVQLRDFEMTPFPHSTLPKDFRSELTIIRDPFADTRREEVRATSLNNPLLVRVPFVWRSDKPTIVNIAAWLVGWVAPNQYKLSQTGWDASGWNSSRSAADRGEVPRPLARFTILGIGNNPGIYVIAAGGVMMSLGTLWAFYVKPWLVQREKRRIQQALAAGTYVRPGTTGPGANGPGAGAAGPAGSPRPEAGQPVPKVTVKVTATEGAAAPARSPS